IAGGKYSNLIGTTVRDISLPGGFVYRNAGRVVHVGDLRDDLPLGYVEDIHSIGRGVRHDQLIAGKRQRSEAGLPAKMNHADSPQNSGSAGVYDGGVWVCGQWLLGLGEGLHLSEGGNDSGGEDSNPKHKK